MNVIEQEIANTRHEILKLEQSIDWAVKYNLLALPEKAPIVEAYFTEHNGLAILIPPGNDNLRKTRQAIGRGWERGKSFVNDKGDVFIRYFQHGIDWPYLLVIIDASYADGASCRVETIGTRTVEIKRVVCNGREMEARG